MKWLIAQILGFVSFELVMQVMWIDFIWGGMEGAPDSFQEATMFFKEKVKG